ncbi:DNA-binding protein HU-alpha [Gammaproteobacteria bacterium]
MNKTELAQALAKKFELSINKTTEIVSQILELITKSLVKKETVQLIGFGSFSIKKRKARNGRNPKTGETIKIAACNAVRFSVGKALKKAINSKK